MADQPKQDRESIRSEQVEEKELTILQRPRQVEPEDDFSDVDDSEILEERSLLGWFLKIMKENPIQRRVGIILFAGVLLIILMGVGFGISAVRKNATNKQNEGQSSTEAQETQAQETQNPSAEITARVRLSAVGDNLMHRSVSLAGQQADGSFDFTANYANVASVVSAADLAVINQEAVIGGDDRGIQTYPSFNTRSEVAPALKAVGFDVILGANNHSMDQGINGLLNEIAVFQAQDLTLLGVHENASTANSLTVMEVNGIRLALINYTQILNYYADYETSPWITEVLDYDRLEKLLTMAHQSADFVVVFPHWGTDDSATVDDKQREQAKFLSEHGVDLVIGAGPHVIQPTEVMDRNDGGRMLVYWSVGNFQSIQQTEAALLGGLAQVTIAKSGDEVFIEDYAMDYTVTYYVNTDPAIDYYNIVTTYLWDDYQAGGYSNSFTAYENPEYSYETLKSLHDSLAADFDAVKAGAGSLR